MPSYKKERYKDIDERFSEAILKYCNRKDISIKALSLAMDVDYNSLQNYVNKRTEPTISTFAKVIRYLGVSADYIINGGGKR